MNPCITTSNRHSGGIWSTIGNFKFRSSTKRGFTLVEIMVVIGIISIIGAMAIPVYRKVTLSTKNTQLINDVMKYSDAYNSYYFLNGKWPSGAGKNKVPKGMQGYLPSNYAKGGPFGGEFHWTGSGKLKIKKSEVTTETMVKLDERIDDGDLSTGQFQKKGSKQYELKL